MTRRLVALAFVALVAACGPEDDTEATPEDTGLDDGGSDAEDAIHASCYHPTLYVCSNLLDERQLPYFCTGDGDERLDEQCPRDAMLGACVGIGIEYVYLEGHAYGVEHLQETCDTIGTWVWE